VGNLKLATPTLYIVLSQNRYQEPIAKWTFVVVCTLILWCTMVSYILFKNRKRIISILSIYVSIKFVTFLKFSEAWLFYLILVANSWKIIRQSMTMVASTQGMIMHKTKPCIHHWWVFHLISVPRILGIASIVLDRTSVIFIIDLTIFDSRPNLTMLRTVIS
jgi:hypothetical protein